MPFKDDLKLEISSPKLRINENSILSDYGKYYHPMLVSRLILRKQNNVEILINDIILAQDAHVYILSENLKILRSI